VPERGGKTLRERGEVQADVAGGSLGAGEREGGGGNTAVVEGKYTSSAWKKRKKPRWKKGKKVSRNGPVGSKKKKEKKRNEGKSGEGGEFWLGVKSEGKVVGKTKEP